MKKPSKTAAELEASIKVEMEDICDWPTHMMISVEPDGDSWKVAVMQEGAVDDVDRREMVEQIGAVEGLTSRTLSCRQRCPVAVTPFNIPAFTDHQSKRTSVIAATLDRFQPMSRSCKNVASPVNSIASG
jgi:hypothetical protein